MRRKKITTEDEAIRYIEYVLKNWLNWRTHHTALVQSLEIILSKVKR
jgi:hypothetical protein